MKRDSYEAPRFKELGTLRELTAGSFNKVGQTPDSFTAVTNGVVIGSLVSP